MLKYQSPPEYFLILLFLGIFLLTWFLLPRIRKISLKFDLIHPPEERSSHKGIVPTFGGVAFYIGLTLTLFAFQSIDTDDVIISLLTSLSIMFFIGLKDDFQDVSTRMKSLGQLISIGLLMFHAELRITSFYGFMGIYEIHPLISVLLSLFILIGLINAYNLIDGIDGMASIIGIVVATSLGLLFFNLKMHFYLAVCVALVAMLFSFLRYNFSSSKKIFMGDTGSLLIGLVLGVLTMRLLSLGYEPVSAIAISRSEIPLLLLCILIIPAFDISRVIFIRLSNNLPVFSPDRNHIHHVLIDAGLTHKKASITVGIINFSIILVMYFSIRFFGLLPSIFISFTLILLLIYFFFVINKAYQTKKIKVKIRKYLFRLFSKLSFKSNVRGFSRENRIAFNRKLKNIRILFF